VTESRSINLFADGTVSSAYRLVEAGEGGEGKHLNSSSFAIVCHGR